MRLIFFAALVACGCASTTERVPSPPAIVLDPPPRAGVPPVVQSPARPPAFQSQEPYAFPAETQPMGSRFSEWWNSGRGWTWGAATYGPVRDEGLDRLMADTLGSSSPHYSSENPTAAPIPADESWLFPSTPTSSIAPRQASPVADRRELPRSTRSSPSDSLDDPGLSDDFERAPAAREQVTAPRRSPAAIPRPSDNWQPTSR